MIKYITIREIKTFFEQQQGENYYKPKRAGNFHTSNYIEYESNGDRNLSLDKYLNKIEP